jgi:hypothetical protein
MRKCPLVVEGTEITIGWNFAPAVRYFRDAVKSLKILVDVAIANSLHECRLMLLWKIEKRERFAVLRCERAQQARTQETTNKLSRSTTKATSIKQTCNFIYRFKVSLSSNPCGAKPSAGL